MYLCYVDESGDKGYERSLTNVYALGVLVIPDTNWTSLLNRMIGYRRWLSDRFGIPVRTELKSGHFVHNTGPFESLKVNDETRMKLYGHSLQLLSGWHVTDKAEAFAVVVDKEWMKKCGRTDLDAQVEAWTRTVERLETMTRKRSATCMILPDEGEYHAVKAIIREKRRYSCVPSHFDDTRFERPAELIIEDPFQRKSHESYFVQFADYLAYAAYRAVYPRAWCGARYWEKVGDARIADVSKYDRLPDNPVGIKLWPPLKWRDAVKTKPLRSIAGANPVSSASTGWGQIQ